MFSLIWRFMPGPAWLRIAVMMLVLIALIVTLLFYGYPLFANLLESGTDVSTVESST